MKAVETDNNVDIRQVAHNIKEDINNPLVQKNITEAVKRLAGFLSIGQMGERVFSDLLVTWWIIALFLAGWQLVLIPVNFYNKSNSGSSILSLLWILLMRYLSGLMVWLSIISVTVGLGCLVCFSCYRFYLVTISTDPEADKNILQVTQDQQHPHHHG